MEVRNGKMEAKKVYAQLERDFIKPGITDDWMKYMKQVGFLSEEFLGRLR